MQQQTVVDILCDSENFYLKILHFKKSTEKSPMFHIRRIPMCWNRQISMTNSKKAETDDWESLKLKNLNSFMKLYAAYEVIQDHFLVVHRGYLSLYNILGAQILKDASEFIVQDEYSLE